jgi:hypothetical protein
MNVGTQEGLLIRAYDGEAGSEAFLSDATSYKSNITQTDIVTPAVPTALGYVDRNTYANLSTWRISPVTATASLNGTTIDGYNLSTMTIEETKTYTAIVAGDINATTGKVIDISFWLLHQGTTDLPIALEDLTITAGNALGAQDAVVNAVKLAIWKAADGATPVASPSAVTFGLDNDYNFAFTLGTRGYDSVDETNNYIFEDSKTSLLAAQEEYYKTSGTDTADIFSITLAGADPIATLTKNVPTLVTVRIYIEGWDAQCTNAILAAIFTINFKFTLQQ